MYGTLCGVVRPRGLHSNYDVTLEANAFRTQSMSLFGRGHLSVFKWKAIVTITVELEEVQVHWIGRCNGVNVFSK